MAGSARNRAAAFAGVLSAGIATAWYVAAVAMSDMPGGLWPVNAMFLGMIAFVVGSTAGWFCHAAVRRPGAVSSESISSPASRAPTVSAETTPQAGRPR